MYECPLSLFYQTRDFTMSSERRLQSQEIIIMDCFVYLLTWLLNVVSQVLQEL